MQREKTEANNGGGRGRRAAYEEIGRYFVEHSDDLKDAVEGWEGLTNGLDLDADARCVILRAFVRARAEKAEKGAQTP